MLLRLEQSHMLESRSDSDTPPHSYHHHNQTFEMYERKACIENKLRKKQIIVVAKAMRIPPLAQKPNGLQ